MGKENTGDFSPEELFDSGVLTGEEIAREELAGQLIENGFNESEVYETLYADGTDVFRPRKGSRKRGKINCSAKQRATMPQICKGSSSKARLHDPAPKRGKKRHARRYDPATTTRYVTRVKEVARKSGRKAKGLLGKLKPYIMPASAGLTFYAAYTQRAADMEANPTIYKNQDGTPVTGVLQAIMWDAKNFKSQDAMTRVKNNAVSIIAPAALGYGVKNFKLAGKYSGMAGDLLMGFAAGTAAKTILDPPVPTQNVSRANVAQQTAQVAARAAAQNAAPRAEVFRAPVRTYEQTVRQLPLYAKEGGY